MSTEECSSNESGWTAYIASSPDKDPTQDEDDEYGSSMDERINQQESEDDAENMDTDDSMASDASSGPSDRRRLSNAVKKNERNGGDKSHKQEEEKKIGEKIKVEEEKSETKGNSGKLSEKK